MADINKILKQARDEADGQKEKGIANNPVINAQEDPKLKSMIPSSTVVETNEDKRAKSNVALKGLLSKLANKTVSGVSLAEEVLSMNKALARHGYIPATAPQSVVKALSTNIISDTNDWTAVVNLSTEIFNAMQHKSSFVSNGLYLQKDYGNGKIPSLEGLNVPSNWEEEAGSSNSTDLNGTVFQTGPLVTKYIISRRDLEDTSLDLLGTLVNVAADSQLQKLEQTLFKLNSTATHDNYFQRLQEKRRFVANSKLTAEQLATLKESLAYDAYNEKGAYIMRRDMKISSLTLKDGSGAYVYKQSMEENRPDLIYGRKVYCSDYLPITKTEIDGIQTSVSPICYADLSTLEIITSPTLELLVDPYGDNAENGTITIYIRKRYAIKLPVQGAISCMFNVAINKEVSDITTIGDDEFATLLPELKNAVPNTSLENIVVR